MGNTKSKNKTTTNIVNNTVNQTTMDMLNQNIFNASVNTLIKNAQTCSNSTNVNANCSASGIKTTGGITINSDQTNKVDTNFACVQQSQAAADMSTSMMQELTAQMDTMSDTDYNSLAKALTDSQQTSGAGTLGNTESSNSTNTNITNDTKNIVNLDVQNIFEQNLNNNFTSDTVATCINKTDVNANTSIDNAEGEFLDMTCKQYNDVKTVAECQQLADAVSKTTTETLNKLGLSIAAENTTATTTVAESTTISENTATGVLQDAAGLVDAFTGLFAAWGLASMAPFIGICCLVCCCLIIVMVVGKSAMGGGDDDSADGNGDYSMSSMSSMLNQAKGYASSKGLIGGGGNSTNNLMSAVFN